MENLVLKIKKASEVKCVSRFKHKSCPRNLVQFSSTKKILIGRGAFGKVYKCIESKTNFKYVAKVIKIDEGVLYEKDNCLEDDINIFRDIIKHPRITEYYGSLLCSPNMYIIMEFVPKSLYDEIKTVQPMPHQRIIRYAKQILEGLEFLHSKSIIHRDIKPQNILLNENDNIKLCDFGLSMALESIFIQSEIQSNNDQPRKGALVTTLCGTTNYMAPEVIIGEGYSFPADIWSLGATIIHMLTGKPPYSDLNMDAAVLFKIATTRKIEFQPLEPVTDNMRLFMDDILNPDPLKRLTAKELLHFLFDHDMVDIRKIHLACLNGNIDIVTLLIGEKCDIEASDEYGWRPIHYACDRRHADIVRLLIAQKCDINACDKNDWQPIHFACQSGSVEIVKLLMGQQCDMEAYTKEKKSPFSLAVQYGHKQLIKEVFHEIFKKQKVLKIKQALEIECDSRCKHEYCPISLIRTRSQKKTSISNERYRKVYKLTDPGTNFEYTVKSIELYVGEANVGVKDIEYNINKYRDIIKHQRIVEYFGSVFCSPKTYIFMEYFSKSLLAEIPKVGSLPHPRIFRYTQQILEGLEFLEKENIVHRDIKPDNILLDENDNLKLCGFGHSKVLKPLSMQNDEYSNDDKLRKVPETKRHFGSHHYMAPEVIRGETYCFPADIWSTGATIVHMLTGKPLFYGPSDPIIIMMKIAKARKIEFDPLEEMTDIMKLFMVNILNIESLKRPTATELLRFMNKHTIF